MSITPGTHASEDAGISLFLIFHTKNLIHEKYDKLPINITPLLIQSTCAGADVIIEHLDNGFCGIIRSHRALMIFTSLPDFQHAKKVVSDSLGQVEFSIRLINSVLNLPNRQVKIFEEFKLQNMYMLATACLYGNL